LGTQILFSYKFKFITCRKDPQLIWYGLDKMKWELDI